MRYYVEFTDKEKKILASLVQRRIETIQDLSGSYSVSYSIRLNFEDTIIDFTPDEISTPEKDKPLADVTRPLITDDQSQLRPDLSWSTIAENVGTIKKIAILQTLVTFSQFLSPTDTNIHTIVYGTGEAWKSLLHHPGNLLIEGSENLSDQSIVNLDIGVAIFTDKGLVITIFTDAHSYFVYGEIADKLPDTLKSQIALKFIDES